MTANSWVLYGNHLYVTVRGLSAEVFEYRAKNILDAHSFVGRLLKGIEESRIEWSGDTPLNFVYQRAGD